MDSIFKLKQTKLFSTLVEKEKEDNNVALSSKIEEIVNMVSPLLERIPENMTEYTLHDSSHSLKIINLMGKIIPEKVILNLNNIEISLLILSAYLHDIGMTCSKEEREKIIKDDVEYGILFKSNIEKFQKFEKYKLNNNHRGATFIEDQIFTEYLRRNHVKRSRDFIKEKLSKGEFLLSYNNIPFYKLLIKVCDGHGEPVKKIYNNDDWPLETLIGENTINVQFLTLVLRLADILDLDSERTPKVIYEFVNPEDPISIIEWKKHLSIIGTTINTKKILFQAECSSPEVERALRQFIDWIEIERKETIELLKTYSLEHSSKYYLELNEQVTKARINSDKSYIYNELMFGLDYQRIMSLLMGQKLYKDPVTSLRELLQNSIDAIKVRQKLYDTKSEIIRPSIVIDFSHDHLSISDNGIGMNEEIFQKYFLQIGKSYYSSASFYSKFSDVDITSEFGIGILSVFMIASSFTIESRREPDNYLKPYLPINFEIPTAQSFLIQRFGVKKEIGTKITLKLKENNPFRECNLYSILEEILPDPPFPVHILENGVEHIYEGKLKNELATLDYNNLNIKDFFSQNRITDLDWEHNFSHTWLNINFENDEDDYLKDIKGDLILVNSNPINYYRKLSGYLSHRSFSVGFPETYKGKFSIKTTKTIESLFPNWLSYYSSLNFTGKACLSITPDRCDFTIDEKFGIIKSKIEKKIIFELDKHFNQFKKTYGYENFNKYLDFLFVSGFFGIDLNELRGRKNFLSPESKSFLLKHISFPVLDDGKLNRVVADELISLEKIGIILSRLGKSEIEGLQEFKKNNIKLILLSNFYFEGDRYDMLFLSLFGSTKHFIKPIKLLLRPLINAPIYIHRINSSQITPITEGDYDDINFISNSDAIDEDIPVIFNLRKTDTSPQFNIQHPLISFLFSKEEILSKERKELKTKLSADLRFIMNKCLDFYRNSSDINLVRLTHKKYTFEQFETVFENNPNILDELDKLFENLWNDAKKLKLIDKDEKYQTIDSNAFPWFWSAKAKT